MGVPSGALGAEVGWEGREHCAAWAPPLGFVPSAELVFVQVLDESGCTQGLKDPAEEMWPLTSFTHTEAQHLTSASTWGRVIVTKNRLCSGLSVSRGKLNTRDLSSLKTKKDK